MTDRPDKPLAKQPIKLLIFVVLMGAVAFIAAWYGWKWAGSGREDLAQWLPAAAAIATLLAAMVAAVFAAGAFRLESDRETQWVRTKEREQADQVACWAVSTSTYYRINAADPLKARTRAKIHLRNQSNQPIYEPALKVYVHQENTDGNVGGEMVFVEEIPPVLAPHEDLVLVVKPFIHELANQTRAVTASELDHEPIGRVGVRLRFRDVQGQWWLRDQQGYLHKQEATGP